ncbi:MAG TPA: amino acid adenylation domain-containing protein [Terriglobia bacterium]|nr:amino acid adenylation domain-containing protein [Terriglobia bacterium]
MGFLLQHLTENSASRLPDQVAVWARGESLTYRHLEERSNQLARLLHERGVRKGDRVGIYFPKSVASVVSMIGVLKAGGVYVPLDSTAPATRVGLIIDNCKMKALVTTAGLLKRLDPNDVRSVEFSVLAEDKAEVTNGATVYPWSTLQSLPTTAPLGMALTTTDLAYILYTSGSTGKPKGVMISHQNALTFVEWCADTFQIQPDDHLSNHAPLHFDLSVFDIYNGLKAGATVYMIPPETQLFPASLAGFIESNGISVWYSVPSALVHLILHGGLKSRNLEKLRLILFAGEVFPMKYLRQLAEVLPSAELYNLYGPTETNVCTYYRVDRAQLPFQERLPIGKACANTEVFAVDDQDRWVGPGETGELYVRGPSVTPGYWADTEKTRKMVVPNRFQPHYEERLYRTGDMVKLLEDGNYDFMGRRDSQIKSRGYRIELGEIEAAMMNHPGVKEAVAVPVPDEEVGNRIRAIVALHQEGSISAADLQQHCAIRVPSYMVPEAIEFREVLPKTSTGKVDRVRLASEAVTPAT